VKLFQGSFFKKTAHVIIGDPPQTFKDYQQKFMKKAKQEAAVEKQIADEKKANAERLQKLNALKRKKQEEVRKKQIEKAKKKAEKEKKKALKAAQKKAAEAKKQALLRKKEAEKKKKEAEKKKKAEERKKKEEEIAKKREAGEEVEDLPPEEEEPEEEEKAEPEEEKKDEEPESEEEKEDEEDPKSSEQDAEMAELEKPVKIELDKSAMDLTDEEKKLTFRKLAHSDMTTANLASAFGNFTLPTKAEGFQDIKFVWSKQPDCEKKLKSWKMAKKSTERIEDLVPGDWFKEQYESWTKEREEMKKKAKEFTSKKPEKKEEKKEEVKEEEKKEEEVKEEEVKEEETKEESKEVKKEEEEPEPDIWECSDIQDADGKGQPLYALFQNEDWALVNLRYDLHLLVHAWEVDVNDDERPGILVEHLNFYYNKYYKRTFNTTYFGCKTLEELLDLIKGTLSIESKNKQKVLKATNSKDEGVSHFVKATEEARRERTRRIAAGDETARLKFSGMASAGQKRPFPGGAGGGPAATRPRGPGVRPQWRPYAG